MSPTTMLPRAAVVVSLLACPALARADYPETAPVRPFQLTDLAGLTQVGMDVQYTTWKEQLPGGEEEELGSVTVEPGVDFTLEPHWQLFARVPLAYADVEIRPNDDSDCCGWGLGNLTLGGRYLYSERYASGVLSVMGGEISLSLATAADEGDGGAALAAAALARYPHDPGKYLPDTWTPRLVVYRQLYGAGFIAQAEGGLHLFLYDDDVPDDDLDLGLRLGLAGGYRVTSEVALIIELNSLFVVNVDDDVDDELSASLDMGVRYGNEGLLLGLRVYVPIDDFARDLDMLGVGVDAGFRL